MQFNKMICLSLLLIPLLFAQNKVDGVVIASKKFTENVILGEILTRYLTQSGIPASHKRELGGTRVLWNALLRNDIQIYPDYTSTVINEILPKAKITDFQSLLKALKTFGLSASPPLGFNNTYALGMKSDFSKQYAITTISDLIRYPDLKFGFTNEFMNRHDGWPGLKKFYQLPQTAVFGLDHDLAYRGLENGDIQLTDLYSTDAAIKYYHLIALVDNRHFFPEYQAIYIYREDVIKQYPKILALLQKLSGTIDEKKMIAMNSAVKIDGKSEAEVASDFLQQKMGVISPIKATTRFSRLINRSKEHLFMVILSLFAAILVSIPLGVVAYKREKTARFILGITGIIQTIPSLALLVFMIPLLGIGGPPAIFALFLYSLLPIVRNTFSGLTNIPRGIIESAIALGLPPFFILIKIELPLALRTILAGIKTSAVINVGTATLGALIGAGGYGQPILTGIRLDDIGLILEGAIPAALLALMVQWGFDFFEKNMLSKGIK